LHADYVTKREPITSENFVTYTIVDIIIIMTIHALVPKYLKGGIVRIRIRKSKYNNNFKLDIH